MLVCDGAMGTMLHAAGAALDRSLPELNLCDPGLVSTIHESYLSAGADVIQANTFGANRLWLGDHGFGDKVAEINRAGVRIARAAQDRCERDMLVAGSVSPAVTALQRRRIGSAERTEVIREQIEALLARGDDPGVDILILETFGYLDELVEAVAVASELSDVPIVAQATFADDAHTLGGETPREVATVLSGLPVAMLGTNCTIGPQRMLTVAEDLVRYASVPVSAQPNAGQPRRTGPRSFEFSIGGDYFARYFRRFAEAGVSLVGGCCGTTPAHIRAAAGAVTAVPAPRTRRSHPAGTARSESHPAAPFAGTLADQLAGRCVHRRRRDRVRRASRRGGAGRGGAAGPGGRVVRGPAGPERPHPLRLPGPGAAPAAAGRRGDHRRADHLGQDHHDPAGRTPRRARPRHPQRDLHHRQPAGARRLPGRGRHLGGRLARA